MGEQSPNDDWLDLLRQPELPSESDRLFESEGEWWAQAILHFTPDRWVLYAIGYKDAADILVDDCRQRDRNQDALIYPVLFLYRHHLELSLKDLIVRGRKLLDIDEPFPAHHKLNELWSTCDSLFDEIAPNDSMQERQNIGRLIDEFVKVDPLATAFRYPIDRDGSPSLPGVQHIDLLNVKRVIGRIAVILDGADAMIDEYSSFKQNMGQ